MNIFNVIVEQQSATVMSHYEALPREVKGYESEQVLENAFIHQLTTQGYERVNITTEAALIANLREQLCQLNGLTLSNSEWKRLFEQQSRIVSILDTLEATIANLEQQLIHRQKQYEYYRNKLLTFE